MKNRRLQAESEIEKWESSPVRISGHKFNQPDRLKELDVRTRGQLAIFFDAWLTHHEIQKDRWKKMVKTRWLLQRLKTNRILSQWKRLTRESKVRKVKQAMICHSRYRASLKLCFGAWKKAREIRHMGLRLLCSTIDRYCKGLVI